MNEWYLRDAQAIFGEVLQSVLRLRQIEGLLAGGALPVDVLLGIFFQLEVDVADVGFQERAHLVVTVAVYASSTPLLPSDVETKVL